MSDHLPRICASDRGSVVNVLGGCAGEERADSRGHKSHSESVGVAAWDAKPAAVFQPARQ